MVWSDVGRLRRSGTTSGRTAWGCCWRATTRTVLTSTRPAPPPTTTSAAPWPSVSLIVSVMIVRIMSCYVSEHVCVPLISANYYECRSMAIGESSPGVCFIVVVIIIIPYYQRGCFMEMVVKKYLSF